MGMNTHVVGIRPPDEMWKKMKAARDACVAADVPIPDEVMEFFNYEEPDSAGVLIDLEDYESCCEKWGAEGKQGFEIDLSKLPENIKLIRFFNSY